MRWCGISRSVSGVGNDCGTRRFPEIEDAIRAITFPEQKAVDLKRALEQITQRCGRLSLDFLKSYRTDKSVPGWNASMVSEQKRALRW